MKRILTVVVILLSVITATAGRVLTGADKLRASGCAMLRGKRVGLITNPSGVCSGFISTAEVIAKADGVTLAAVFGPEHGVSGIHYAGGKYEAEGSMANVRCYSLYGRHTKPTAEMLRGIDVLVYDIQDIGCRSYTYISTMGLCMEAAAENNIPFVVLDRPNPLGGNKVEGCVAESDCRSFVSKYPIPYIYGLTCGELARLLNGEGMLRGGVKCRLTVVPMSGWRRDMLYGDTGLEWVPASPHIPESVTALHYPSSGIMGELGIMSIGVGYTLPFRTFAAEGVDALRLASELTAEGRPGVAFRPISYKPFYQFGKGRTLSGVQVYFTDWEKASATDIQFDVLRIFSRMAPGRTPFAGVPRLKLRMFDIVCGSRRIRQKINRGDWEGARRYWHKDDEVFRKLSAKYLLYH